MSNRGVLSLLIVALALLTSPGLTVPVAAQATLVVDVDNPSCTGGIPDFSTIFEAILIASSGDTIHVCDGDYTEPTMTIYAYKDHLTITGPGATPENDGVATVHHSGGLSWLIGIEADYVVVEGLDLDATSYGIENSGNSVFVQNNEIRNAGAYAVSSPYGTQNVRILSNNIHDSAKGVFCVCDDSAVSGNTVTGLYSFALDIEGDRTVVTDNVVNGRVYASGDDLLVSSNNMSGPALTPLLGVLGARAQVTDNTLSDTSGYGIQVTNQYTSTDVTIARNTFTRVDKPISLWDPAPGDSVFLTATIGGSASEANTFIDSGGSLGDSNYLVQMDGSTLDVNATYNKWGLCTLAEIEQEIYDQVDDPAQGLVDFDPFIASSGCSTPTPTPTPTATPTGTPTPGTTRTLVWGPGWHNAAWSGASTPEEAFACAAGNFAAAYRLVSGGWERHFPNRLDISNMQDFEQYDAFFILVTQDTTCQMPLADPPGSLRTLDWGVGWNNDGWTGPDGTAPEEAFSCAVDNYAAAYRLVSGGWERYFPDRPDISNMGPLNKYDAFLILVTAPVSCTMAIAP